MSDLDKKRMYCLRLLGTVYEYFGVFDKPIPLSIISAKYAKSLDHHGYGFHKTLMELELEGSIRIELKETGGKVLYPGIRRR